jgi:hypothetical protein
MTKTSVVNAAGQEIDFEAATALMDSDLREKIHLDGDFDEGDSQKFIELYAAAHVEKFGEDFAPYHGGAW